MKKPTYEELAAQLESSWCAFKELHASMNFDDSARNLPESTIRKFSELAFVYKKTPQQCLAERDAASGRAGYLQGHLDAGGNYNDWHKKHSEYHADKYAEQIRQGGVK